MAEQADWISPELQRLESAKDYFDAVYPDALIIVPAVLRPREEKRLLNAGLGMAEALLPDGSTDFSPFILQETPFTQALSRIADEEISGNLLPGSYDDAIECIMNGEFVKRWGVFLCEDE